MLQGKRVFISGGNGVIGNELTQLLNSMGAIVFVGDLKPRPASWPANIQYRQGDLNFITQAELEHFAPQFFFHLAATFERSTETYDFWHENRKHNVQLSTHLMTLLKDLPSLEKVIFASSYLIYDPKLYKFKTPADSARRLLETDPILPRNLTGAAKLNHEIELRFLNEFKSGQFTSVSARIYRSYGINSRDVISRWVRSLLRNESLEVFKKEGLFDYIFAGDVAKGLLLLATTPGTEGIYNLGNDNARRVSEVLEILKKHFPDLAYTEAESPIDYEASQANMDYFFAAVGWRPENQLEDVIPKIIEFESRQMQDDPAEASEPIGVLITSISRKTGLIQAVRTACQKLGSAHTLIGADLNENCIGRFFVDEFWAMPALSDLSFDRVLEYCRQKNIRLIIPSRDGELPFWSGMQSQLLANGVSVMISNTLAVNLCLDKLEFSEKLIAAGFNAIASYAYPSNHPYPPLCVVKERFGAGSLKIVLNIPTNQIDASVKNLETPIIQPFIRGEEYSVDVYFSLNGKDKGAVCRRREVVMHGESQITTTKSLPELEQLCLSVGNFIGIRGHAVFQVLLDDAGKFHIIECNCRFGGASTLSIKAGLDTFYWALLEALGSTSEQYPFLPSSKELKQIRYAADLIVEG